MGFCIVVNGRKTEQTKMSQKLDKKAELVSTILWVQTSPRVDKNPTFTLARCTTQGIKKVFANLRQQNGLWIADICVSRSAAEYVGKVITSTHKFKLMAQVMKVCGVKSATSENQADGFTKATKF